MDEDWDALDPDNFPDIDPAGGLDDALIFGGPETRRRFFKQVAGTSAAITSDRRSWEWEPLARPKSPRRARVARALELCPFISRSTTRSTRSKSIRAPLCSMRSVNI